MAQASFTDIKREFDETLGYIRQDVKWLLDHNSGLNYTIALLVGCGCEMLADCRGGTKGRGEMVFAELLPSEELRVLANRLYGALRDGLAHGFDTKHLFVDGTEHQVYLDSRGPQEIAIVSNSRGIGLRIGIRSLAEALPEGSPAEGRFEQRRSGGLAGNGQDSGLLTSPGVPCAARGLPS